MSDWIVAGLVAALIVGAAFTAQCATRHGQVMAQRAQTQAICDARGGVPVFDTRGDIRCVPRLQEPRP